MKTTIYILFTCAFGLLLQYIFETLNRIEYKIYCYPHDCKIAILNINTISKYIIWFILICIAATLTVFLKEEAVVLVAGTISAILIEKAVNLFREKRHFMPIFLLLYWLMFLLFFIVS